MLLKPTPERPGSAAKLERTSRRMWLPDGTIGPESIAPRTWKIGESDLPPEAIVGRLVQPNRTSWYPDNLSTVEVEGLGRRYLPGGRWRGTGGRRCPAPWAGAKPDPSLRIQHVGAIQHRDPRPQSRGRWHAPIFH